MALTRRQRNELFQTLDEKGIDPDDCELDTSAGTSILHIPSQSVFRIIEDADGYHSWWHVVDGPDSRAESSPITWTTLLEQLGYWAEEAQYVADVPDFWVELRQAPQVLAAVQQADASNAPFTPDEQAEIARRLDDIKQLVREQFELTDEQLAAIGQRLDDAEEASKRLGRKDWVMMFYGAVISTGMADAVPPGVIQTVLATVVHGIAHIFGIGGPPPIIST